MAQSNQTSLSRESTYRPPRWLLNGHMGTIYPALFRKVKLTTPYLRERIDTEDGDFLDLDWLSGGKKQLVILCHGLEGSSDRPYIRGMADAFWTSGFDVLAWNYRSCSEEMNRSLTMYHSGATDDLDWVVKYAVKRGYERLFLVGFSLGGNLILKYLGERDPITQISRCVVFSVPLDLSAGSDHISRLENRLYERRFLKSLKRKLLEKNKQHPELKIEAANKAETLRAFDELFTAPMHGFRGAEDYYRKCSSKFFVDTIKTPTLVINADNDPFLPQECRDPKLFENASSVLFELPQYGGHCGFVSYRNRPWYWSEQRAVAFCLSDE